ncbi:hypothetical protein BC829DRAFT_442507 [Chytridium lagenaria]|nr:hypothetical protein BC829DRAFT_442507 [Chytridium lagenaria]
MQLEPSRLRMPHELEEVTIRGVPQRVFKNAPKNMVSLLRATKSHTPFPRSLMQGLQKGDRIAILMKNSITIGAIVVPINGWLKPNEVGYLMESCSAAALFVDTERLEPLSGRIADGFTRLRLLLPEWVGVTLKFNELEETVKEDELPDIDICPDDDATCETALSSCPHHRNFLTNLLNSSSTVARDSLRKGLGFSKSAPQSVQTTYLLSVPLFHVIGCHSVMGGCMATGAKMVMMEKWDPVGAMKLVERERVTNLGGVPAVIWQVGSLKRTVILGGAPAPRDLLDAIKKRLPKIKPAASNGYGLTETSALVSRNVGVDYELKPDSVGPTVLTVDVRIVIPGTWDDVELGGIGEVIVKTLNLLYILDRAKDMLIRGGENIYCVEVENCIFSHHAVMDCAVVGLPHKILGEEVAAAMQIKPEYRGKITQNDIIHIV